MDATESRRRQRLLIWAEGGLFVLAAIAGFLGHPIVGLILAALAVVAAVAWLRVPRIEDPDPELPDELASELRERRDAGEEVPAVRELRKRYPNLGLVQAVRIVRTL